MLKTIWVIDDDVIYKFIIEKMMLLDGYELKREFFENADEAIARLKSLTDEDAFPDYILLDLMMPDSDGFKFLDDFNTCADQLKKRPEIFVVTSSLSINDKKKATSSPHVNGYFEKPLSAKTIEKLVFNKH